jgi:gamma-glutamyltranspeptidase/glutathione hydrolase
MWAEIFERECSDGYGYVLKGAVNEFGHAAVTTPGIMRVFGEAHRAYGRLPWAELFSPAIGFAEGGWVIRPHVAYMFSLNETAYGRRPMADKLAFTEAGGLWATSHGRQARLYRGRPRPLSAPGRHAEAGRQRGA